MYIKSDNICVYATEGEYEKIYCKNSVDERRFMRYNTRLFQGQRSYSETYKDRKRRVLRRGDAVRMVPRFREAVI